MVGGRRLFGGLREEVEDFLDIKTGMKGRWIGFKSNNPWIRFTSLYSEAAKQSLWVFPSLRHDTEFRDTNAMDDSRSTAGD